MKKIWSAIVLCMMLCVCFVGCSKDDEVINEKTTTEKRTEIIKQKTNQKNRQRRQRQRKGENQIKICNRCRPSEKQMSKQEAIGPGSDKTKPMVSSGDRRCCDKKTRVSGEFRSVT